MATLAQVIAGDYAYNATAGGAAFAIKQYMSNNALMNVLNFVPKGSLVGAGDTKAFMYTYGVFKSNVNSIKSRSMGEDYVASNNIAALKNVYLKIFGGNYAADRAMLKAMALSGRLEAKSYEEEQLALKMDDLVNGFARLFVKGDSSVDPEEMDGLNKIISSDRIKTTPIDLTDLKDETALATYAMINNAVQAVPGANVIVTTVAGAGILGAVSTRAGMLNNISNIGRVELPGTGVISEGVYVQTFGNTPVIALTNDCFTDADLLIGSPVYILRCDDKHGCKVVTQNGGELIAVYPLDMDMASGVVKTGGVEMIAAVAIEDKFAAAKIFIKSDALAFEFDGDNSDNILP